MKNKIKIKFSPARYEQGNCEVITKDGNPVRIFCTDFKDINEPLVIGAVTYGSIEILMRWDIFGLHLPSLYVPTEDKYHIYLLVEDDTPSCYFKPFDRVLVRDDDTHKWECELFRRYKKDCSFPYECIGNNCSYSQCILYEGNETLADTTKFPKNK